MNNDSNNILKFSRLRAIIVGFVTLLSGVGIYFLIRSHLGDIGQTLLAIPIEVIGAVVILQILTMVGRSEVWRLCIGACNGKMPATPVYAANAFTQLANSMNQYLGSIVRIIVLRKLEPERSPKVGQLFVTNLPAYIVEAFVASILLAISSATLGLAWWIPVVAISAVLVISGLLYHIRHRFKHRPSALGLNALTSLPHLTKIVAITSVVLVLQVLRIWLVLMAVGLNPSLFAAVAVLIGIGILSALPIGPSTGPAATLAVFGSASVATAAAAGIAIAATTLIGILVFALWALGVVIQRFLSSRFKQTKAQPHPVRRPLVWLLDKVS